MTWICPHRLWRRYRCLHCDIAEGRLWAVSVVGSWTDCLDSILVRSAECLLQMFALLLRPICCCCNWTKKWGLRQVEISGTHSAVTACNLQKDERLECVELPNNLQQSICSLRFLSNIMTALDFCSLPRYLSPALFCLRPNEITSNITHWKMITATIENYSINRIMSFASWHLCSSFVDAQFFHPSRLSATAATGERKKRKIPRRVSRIICLTEANSDDGDFKWKHIVKVFYESLFCGNQSNRFKCATGESFTTTIL